MPQSVAEVSAAAAAEAAVAETLKEAAATQQSAPVVVVPVVSLLARCAALLPREGTEALVLVAAMWLPSM